MLAQAPAPSAPGAVPTPAPTPSGPSTPTDDFGPDLKAWLDATKLQDKESAAKALLNLQRRRAERNLFSIDDVAGALSGRAETRAAEGTAADAIDGLDAAITFAPDSSAYQVRKATVEGKMGAGWRALSQSWANPFERGRLRSMLLLGLLITGALFAAGFSFALLLRYAAVFSHDVTEGLPGALKSLALFMSVLFLALPLAGFMGWGYLPFWWATLFFIFASRPERIVSLVLIVGLGLSGLALPLIEHQRAIEAARDARTLYLLADGGTSVDAEALVAERLAKDPSDAEWSLLSANLSRRGGRFDEAAAALQPRASADPRFDHNAAVLEFNKAIETNSSNYDGARPGFTRASESASALRDKATALYNLSLVEANSLQFDPAKATRAKGDALDAALLARYDRLYSFDRNGSMLQAPPDIVPDPMRIVAGALPEARFTTENAFGRLSVIALVLLLIPAVVRFRGAQSFSKQCPKCGTTFCWLCQTRSTSQDVCSQCHHLFVVKRGIPPAARSAKNAEISAYVTRKALFHRLASLAAPGSGHLAVGHFNFGLPVLLAWAGCAGAAIAIHFLAPLILAAQPIGTTLKMVFAGLAVVTYVLAQAVEPRAPVVAPPPRRTRAGADQEA